MKKQHVSALAYLLFAFSLTAQAKSNSIADFIQAKYCDQCFDVVIVGGGSAGMVLARNLTEDPNLSVAVIEAGRDESRLEQLLPLDAPNPIPNPETNTWGTLVRDFSAGTLARVGFVSFNWLGAFRENPQTAAEDRSIYQSRGATWGGCSAHNAFISLRGSSLVYDEWRDLGNDLWSYKQVLPFFKKLENRSQLSFLMPNSDNFRYYNPEGVLDKMGTFTPEFHGDSGQYFSTWFWYEDPLAASLKVAARLVPGLGPDFPVDVDFDIPTPETEMGISSTPLTVYDQFAQGFDAINPYRNPDGSSMPFVFPDLYKNIGFEGAEPQYSRVHTACAFIYDVLDRPNLTIISEALVTKINFDDHKKVTSVEYLEGYNIFQTGRNINTGEAGFGGTAQDAAANAEKAKRNPGIKRVVVKEEVILSAGVYNSPHLLLLSGIGPRKQLEEFGIEVIHDLPGVGEHLVDHAELEITFATRQPFDPSFYFCAFFPSQATNIVMNFKTRPELNRPNMHANLSNGGPDFISGSGFFDLIDVPLDLGASRYRQGPPAYIRSLSHIDFSDPTLLPLATTQTLFLEYLTPKSEGCVKLQSCDPTVPPIIINNYLSAPQDLEDHIVAFRDFVRPWIENLQKPETFFVEEGSFGNPKTVKGDPNDASLSFFDRWISPRPEQFLEFPNDPNSPFDEELYTEYLTTSVFGHHASGTCKMGPDSDPMAVVDQRGRVHGVKGLRVCDASISPVIPGANTSTPAIMYAERMTPLIQADL